MALKTPSTSINAASPLPLQTTPSAEAASSSAAAAAQNALQSQIMQISTAPSSSLATAVPLKMHTFQVTVGGIAYEVTGPLRAEFDADASLIQHFAALFGKAIEAAKSQMPDLDEFTLSFKTDGIKAAPLKQASPGILSPAVLPTLIQNTVELSQKIRETLASPAKVRVKAEPHFQPRSIPLSPDVLPKQEAPQPPPLPLPNTSGVNCYAAALLQMISSNPILNQSLIEGLKPTRPELSALLQGYEEARKRRSNSFSVEKLEEELNSSRRPQDLAELLEKLVENSEDAHQVLKPPVATTVFYEIPENVALPEGYIRDPQSKTIVRKSTMSPSSGIPYKGLSLPRSGHPTLEQVIQYNYNIQRDGGYAEIGNKRYGALHTTDEFLFPPPVLILHLQRSSEATQSGAPAIVDTSVLISERMRLPECLLFDKTGLDEEYQLRSFSVRTGVSPQSPGHFISYVKTKGADGAAEYWSCNNSIVAKISQKEFFEAARQANTVIYNRVAPEDRVLS